MRGFMFSKHVTTDISAYCHGELSAEDSRRFAEHVMSCVKCRREFDEIKLGVRLAEQLPVIAAPESLWAGISARLDGPVRIKTSRRSWQLRFAAVAGVVLIVVSLGVWRFWELGVNWELGRGSWELTWDTWCCAPGCQNRESKRFRSPSNLEAFRTRES